MFWIKALRAGELCLRGYAQYRSMKRGSTTGRMRMSEEVMIHLSLGALMYGHQRRGGGDNVLEGDPQFCTGLKQRRVDGLVDLWHQQLLIGNLEDGNGGVLGQRVVFG